jgi:hypothetical protein
MIKFLSQFSVQKHVKGTVQRKLTGGQKWYQSTAYDLGLAAWGLFYILRGLGP